MTGGLIWHRAPTYRPVSQLRPKPAGWRAELAPCKRRPKPPVLRLFMRFTMINQTTSNPQPNIQNAPLQLKSQRAATKNRDRFRPVPRGALVLQPRDVELLCDLFRQGVMSRGQIQALHSFGSTPRCNFRLRQLYDAGFVSRHVLPGVPIKQSTGVQVLYSLGKAAIPVVALHLGREESEVRRAYRRTQTPLFVQHMLGIGDLRVAFHQAATEGDTNIERWLCEDESRHAFEVRAPGSAWRKEVFKPDAFVRLRRLLFTAFDERCFFIEADLGTTSQEKMCNKRRIHQLYLDTGLFREVYGSQSFRTLVVTTSQRRLEHLLALMEEQGSDLFWFSTFEAVREHGVLAPIWRVPFHEGEVSLWEAGLP